MQIFKLAHYWVDRFWFIMVFGAIQTAPNDWWITSKKEAGIENMSTAYNGVFGQGAWDHHWFHDSFFVAQLIDVFVFHKIKKANRREKDMVAGNRFNIDLTID